MPQHSMLIANQTFPAFRADLNNALSALASLSSAGTAPASPTQYQLWLDTVTTPLVLKFFDGADWIPLLNINAGTDTATPSLAADSLSGDVIHGGTISSFSSTGIGDTATETRLTVTDTETVINESGAAHNTRIEGDNDQNLLTIHATTDRIGIGIDTGTDAPDEKLHVNGRVKASAFTSHTITLEDDTATSIAFDTNTAGWCFISSTNSETARGAFMFKVGTSPFIDSENSIGPVGTITTGSLTGATGADGDFTIAPHTDNKLYLENRTGAPLTFSLTMV